jgi:hypothetical protein
MKSITSKIKSVSVGTVNASTPATENVPTVTVTVVNPLIDVPDVVEGITIRLKGHSDHSTWFTINHMVHDGKLIPIQLFLNSKDPDKFLMLQVLGTSASAIFRHGRDVSFLADEWINTTSSEPYWFKGKLYSSWVSQIGYALRDRLATLAEAKVITKASAVGYSEVFFPTQGQAKDYTEKHITPDLTDSKVDGAVAFPEGSIVCKKCKVKAVVNSGNCLTCLSCGDSKCG